MTLLPKHFKGRVIETVRLTDAQQLRIVFADGDEIAVVDGFSGCCERRYMTCDDDLSSFTGGVLHEIVVLDAPARADVDGEVHEVQFLNVRTSAGVLTCETHNEHNGYYSGFEVSVRLVSRE